MYADRESDELREHDRRVRAMASRLLRNREDVDDVVQESWRIALEPRKRVDSLPAWLTGIVRRVALEANRRRARSRELLLPDLDPEHQGSEADSSILQQLASERLRRAIETLSEPQRTAVVMRFYDDLPPREIAARLGVPVETVRTRLKRSFSTLRVRLERDERVAPTMAPLALWWLRVRSRLRLHQPGGAFAVGLTAVLGSVVVLGVLLSLRDSGGRHQRRSPERVATLSGAPEQAPGVVDLVPDGSTGASRLELDPVELGLVDPPPTRAVSGRVVDQQGLAVGGADVVGWLDPREFPEAPPLFRARTDPAGRFQVPEAPSASFFLRAEDDDGRLGQTIVRSRQGTAELQQIEFVLAEARFVRGVVLDQDGSPAAGVRVETLPSLPRTTRMPGATQGFESYRHVFAEALTDEEGRFELGPLPRIDLRGRVVAEGRMNRPLDLTVDRDTLTLRLPQPSQRVVSVASDGRPVRGAVVEIHRARETTTGETDGDGRFAQTQPPDRHKAYVRVSAPGFATSVEGPLSPTDLRDLRIELEPSRTVRGVLRDAAGAGLPARRLAAMACGLGGQDLPALWPAAARARVLEEVLTDADGRFSLQHVGSAPFQLGLLQGDAQSAVEQLVRVADPERPLELVTDRPPNVRVQVLDGATAVDAEPAGDPCVTAFSLVESSAPVAFRPLPGAERTLGSVLERPDTWGLAVQQQERAPVFLHGALEGSRSVVLHPEHFTRLRILDARSAPVPDAYLVLGAPDGGSIPVGVKQRTNVVRTDRDGFASLPNAPAGPLRVLVLPPHLAPPERQQVDLSRSEPLHELRLECEPSLSERRLRLSLDPELEGPFAFTLRSEREQALRAWSGSLADGRALLEDQLLQVFVSASRDRSSCAATVESLGRVPDYQRARRGEISSEATFDVPLPQAACTLEWSVGKRSGTLLLEAGPTDLERAIGP